MDTHSNKVDFAGSCKLFLKDFREWSFTNNIMIAASGIAIGMATKDAIQNLLEEIVYPFMMFFFQLSIFKSLYAKVSGVAPGFLSSLGKVSWSLFEWIIIIVMTFVLLEYLLNRRIIGLKSTVKEDQKSDYLKAKAEANEPILATHRDAEKIEKKDRLEKQAGKNIQKQDDKKLESVAAGQVPPTVTKETYAERSSDLPGFGFGDSVFHHIFQ